MKCIDREGRQWVVLYNSTLGDILLHDDGFNYIGSYNQNLLYDDGCHRDDSYDIMRVYCHRGALRWARGEPTIFTIDGVDYTESTLLSLIRRATNK